LKATVGEFVSEVLVDVPPPEVLGMVELIPEVEMELRELDEAEIPEVEELDKELEEMGSVMLNVVVWERTLSAFPTLEARMEYPSPAGRLGRTTEIDPEATVTLFASAILLRRLSFAT